MHWVSRFRNSVSYICVWTSATCPTQVPHTDFDSYRVTHIHSLVLWLDGELYLAGTPTKWFWVTLGIMKDSSEWLKLYLLIILLILQSRSSKIFILESSSVWIFWHDEDFDSRLSKLVLIEVNKYTYCLNLLGCFFFWMSFICALTFKFLNTILFFCYFKC